MSSGPGPAAPLFTLAEVNLVEPDEAHYDSTVENAGANFGISQHLRCWRFEAVPVRCIHPFQLIDDPNDHEGNAKAESIRASMRKGRQMPGVMVAHQPNGQFAYWLFEGRHRFNAAHREAAPSIRAWVAHVGCCGAPAPDLVGQP